MADYTPSSFSPTFLYRNQPQHRRAAGGSVHPDLHEAGQEGDTKQEGEMKGCDDKDTGDQQ